MKIYTVGSLAKAVGLSQSTIKNLELRGVLNPQRDEAGRRIFFEKDLEKIQKHYARQGLDKVSA